MGQLQVVLYLSSQRLICMELASKVVNVHQDDIGEAEEEHKINLTESQRRSSSYQGRDVSGHVFDVQTMSQTLDEDQITKHHQPRLCERFTHIFCPGFCLCLLTGGLVMTVMMVYDYNCEVTSGSNPYEKTNETSFDKLDRTAMYKWMKAKSSSDGSKLEKFDEDREKCTKIKAAKDLFVYFMYSITASFMCSYGFMAGNNMGRRFAFTCGILTFMILAQIGFIIADMEVSDDDKGGMFALGWYPLMFNSTVLLGMILVVRQTVLPPLPWNSSAIP